MIWEPLDLAGIGQGTLQSLQQALHRVVSSTLVPNAILIECKADCYIGSSDVFQRREHTIEELYFYQKERET